ARDSTASSSPHTGQHGIEFTPHRTLNLYYPRSVPNHCPVSLKVDSLLCGLEQTRSKQPGQPPSSTPKTGEFPGSRGQDFT
ncbi:MAG: hypothetical protein FWD29_08890, partial [Micrococcales bacterium]|nr:hypothetical protein [Micrococcales bacterium]